jgi:hypothetical protein
MELEFGQEGLEMKLGLGDAGEVEDVSVGGMDGDVNGLEAVELLEEGARA